MKIRCILLFILLLPSFVFAQGSCDFAPGFRVVTHGNLSETTWVVGVINGKSHWVQISNADGTRGKANISVALAARSSGKTLSIYLDAATDTCDNIPEWFSNIRHLQMK